MRRFLFFSFLLIPCIAFGQKLPSGFSCQDLIDTSEGKASRSPDGGRTYVPIKRPQPRDAFGAALLAYDTQLCYRLSRGEITVDQFNALHDEKIFQLRGQKEKALAERQTLANQQQALRNQQAAIQTQREAVQVQRQAATIQALQAEAARQQRERHHEDWMRQQQIQQQQLERIRQEQANPKSFSCFGTGNTIYCN